MSEVEVAEDVSELADLMHGANCEGPRSECEGWCSTLQERLATEWLAAHDARVRADALAPVIALADEWAAIPDYRASIYDEGRVDQRHMATTELLETLERCQRSTQRAVDQGPAAATAHPDGTQPAAAADSEQPSP
jgi:hypothetical protein